jgi:multiple sugar transport system substrate-binding protein
MRKSLALVLAMALLVMCMAPAAMAESKPVKIIYSYWGNADSNVTQTANIAKFNELHKGEIEVEGRYMTTDEYDTKLYTMIAGGDAPDVFFVETASSWAVLAEEGKLMDLTSLLENDPEVNVDSFLPGMVMPYGDKLTALGNEPEVVNLFYSVDLFNKMGVTPPSSDPDHPSTWADVLEIAKQMTLDANGNNAASPNFDPNNIVQYGIDVSKWFVPLQTLVYSNGGAWLTEDGKGVGLLEPEALEALQMVADFINVYHVSPSPIAAKSLPGATTALLTGQLAMYMDGFWTNNNLGASGVNFDIAMLPSFGDKKPVSWLGSSGLSMYADTKNPEAAWELMKYLLRPEGSEEGAKNAVYLSTSREWFEDQTIYDTWTTIAPYHSPNHNKILKSLVLEHTVPSVTTTVKNFNNINTLYMAALDRAWSGEMSVEEALKAAEPDILKEIKGWVE